MAGTATTNLPALPESETRSFCGVTEAFHKASSQILFVGLPAGMVNVALWAFRVGSVLDAEATSANMPVAIRATPTRTSNLAACLKRDPRPSGRTLTPTSFFIRPLPVGSYTLYEHNSRPPEQQLGVCP
jgi:hypothetical protein